MLLTATPGDFDRSWFAAIRMERQDPCLAHASVAPRRFELSCTSCLQSSRQHHPAPLRVCPESSKVLQKDSIMTSLEVRPVPRKLSAVPHGHRENVRHLRRTRGSLCSFHRGSLALHRHGNKASHHHGHINDPVDALDLLVLHGLVCSLHCEDLFSVPL